MSDPVFQFDFHLPLDRFNLSITHRSSHRVLGLFGPSGSGKTTCLEAIAGLRTTAQGTITCNGVAWLDTACGIRIPPEKRNIGYVPQDHRLFPHLAVRGNLEIGRGRAERKGRPWRDTFAEVVDVLELAPLLDRNVRALSGGECQRVSLGRALCSGPELLLLDEPLASLDLSLRQRILPFLLRVRDAFAMPMMVVSHNPTEIQALCDEVVALDQGKVVAHGAPIAVFTRPDVYPLASAEGFENALPATVIELREHTATVRLGRSGDGPRFSVLRPDRALDDTVMLGIPARDILVAVGTVEGISARNRLRATVREVTSIGHQSLLTADLTEAGHQPMVVELTGEAVEELALHPGKEITLLIKTSAVTVFG